MRSDNITFICLGGHIKCGKSTAADSLVQYLDNSDKFEVKKISVGMAIRQEISDLYGIPMSVLLDPKMKDESVRLFFATEEVQDLWLEAGFIHPLIRVQDIYIKIRHLMQLHGTEIRRKYYGDDYWVNKFDKTIQRFIDNATDKSKHYVLLNDDIRMPNEFAVAAKYGAYFYKVWRYPGYNEDISHITEQYTAEFDKWDFRFRPEHGFLQQYVVFPILVKHFGFSIDEYDPQDDFATMEKKVSQELDHWQDLVDNRT